MQGRRPTWQELLEAVDGLAAQNARNQEQGTRQIASQLEQIETLLKEVKHYRKIVPYYQNPNTPPPANSME